MNTWPYVLSLFQISHDTLWRWCKRAKIKPHIDPSDNRRRYLTDRQLLVLARLHHRSIGIDPTAIQLIQADQIDELRARIFELEKSVSKPD